MTREKKRTSKDLLAIGAIAVGIALLALAFLSFQSPDVPESVDSSPQRSEEESFPEIERVSLEESAKAYEAKTAVFVDVRDADDYADAHVPGALSIPLQELNERQNELNRADWIITYCT